MRPNELLLRCFAEQKNGSWQAFCLDFDLAAQGESFEGVKVALESMISEYVFDAVAGEDREFADQLLSRRAPVGLWLRYYMIKARSAFDFAHNGVRRMFLEAMPMVPAPHKHA